MAQKYTAPDTKYATLEAYATDLRSLVKSGDALAVVEYEPKRWATRVTAEFGIYDKFPIYIQARPVAFMDGLVEYGFEHTASNPYDRKYKQQGHKLKHVDGGHIELHVKTHPIDAQFVPARTDGGYVGEYHLDAKMCWPMDKDRARMDGLIMKIATATVSLCDYLVEHNIPAFVPQAGGWNHISDKKDYTVWNPPAGFMPNWSTKKVKLR